MLNNHNNNKKLIILTLILQCIFILSQFFNFIEFIFKPLNNFPVTEIITFIYTHPINGIRAIVYFLLIIILIHSPFYIIFFSNYYNLLFFNEILKLKYNILLYIYIYIYIFFFYYYPLNIYLLISWISNTNYLFTIQPFFDISNIIKSLIILLIILKLFLLISISYIKRQLQNLFKSYTFKSIKQKLIIFNLVILLFFFSFNNIYYIIIA